MGAVSKANYTTPHGITYSSIVFKLCHSRMIKSVSSPRSCEFKLVSLDLTGACADGDAGPQFVLFFCGHSRTRTDIIHCSPRRLRVQENALGLNNIV